ncbi:MAG TPA: TonB-dependent receptor, partial [Vicinamibacterales bacterium]|nr:TonB-dependent receptor [Vicinamibacterales bacterium]
MMLTRGVFGLVCALAVPTVAVAQVETATVLGTITDPQGAALPGVAVTARDIDTGFSRTGVTDAEGRYRIAAIPPGRYEFTAELAGFATFTRKGLTLTVGSESVINAQLSLGSVAEKVTVTAESPVVETTTATVQGQMNRQQIDVLPLIGRDYTDLLSLVPGAQSSNGTSFTGSRGRSNQWQIDGVDNSEDISGYSRQTPSLDAIKEVQVLVNGFKAEYGSASGGIVNVVTRSGTITIDGSAFYLFRNQDMMSLNPYADRALGKDPFRRVHYGATIGGPIKKDRLHYFVTYERQDRDTFSDS